MYAHTSEVVQFVAGFTASALAATGLTVTAKVWELRADGSKVPDDATGTAATVTEIGGGGYRVVHTMVGDGVPFCVFFTEGTADVKCIQTAALSLANLDAAVDTRAPAATALSNEVWTNAKAAFVDAAISQRPTLGDIDNTLNAFLDYYLDDYMSKYAAAVWAAAEAVAFAALVGQTLPAPLTAEGTRQALGLATASLDAQLAGIRGTYTAVLTQLIPLVQLDAATGGVIKRHDTKPYLGFAIIDINGDPVDCSTMQQVRFLARNRDKVLVIEELVGAVGSPAVWIDQAQGLGEYRWKVADTATTGVYEYEFELTDSDGEVYSLPIDGYLTYSVREDIA